MHPDSPRRRTAPFVVASGGCGPNSVNETALQQLRLSSWQHALGSTPVGAELAEHLELRPRGVDADDGSLSNASLPAWADALVDSLVHRQRLLAHLEARQQADLTELARNYPGLAEFVPTEVALALGISEGAASGRICSAMDLLDRLPATFAAMDNGAITPDKAEAIRTHTANLDRDLATLVAHDVLSAAPGRTLPELRNALRRAVIRRDPEGADVRHHKAARHRKITFHALADGMAAMWCTSTATDIARIRAALDTLAEASTCPGDERTCRRPPRRRTGGPVQSGVGRRPAPARGAPSPGSRAGHRAVRCVRLAGTASAISTATARSEPPRHCPSPPTPRCGGWSPIR